MPASKTVFFIIGILLTILGISMLVPYGLQVYHGGQISASFGTTTSIGPTGGKHTLIDSSGVQLKVGSTFALSHHVHLRHQLLYVYQQHQSHR